MEHQIVAVLIRWLHVAAMATILGGALLVGWLAVRGPRGTVVAIAVRYEQLFWAGLGVIVMTGIGNLGAFGLAVPQPVTDWGGRFMAKLFLVGALAALSLPRSLVIARLAGGVPATIATLRWLYGSTVGVVTVVAGIAVWLAHG